MVQNGISILKNVRSTHSEFKDSLEVHVDLICALIGTSQLSIEDWIYESSSFVVDKKGKMYQYICESGVWNENHFLFKAFQ
jgi:hypothetical protein